MNVENQIDYWRKGATEDFEVAELLIEKGRFLHGLFFCHLVMEKILKTHVVKTSKQLAPKSHNLIYLSERSGLSIQDENLNFFGILMKYQLEGRYPDYKPYIPEKKLVKSYLKETQKVLLWLKAKL
ncbi:HEPN domain-containing protein [Algoriphagus chordae]|uniref:HEPN domain-containing protein n=1 Tax=Algoriphagus chordae TaxID=237019 RepID=A0A2W7RDF5_9BACT|nr:HEPN domain-containing protein [Algoriphagus chordae]PZX58151.1 HEPN domain-containing protein [Algoriphagus chordae]